MKASRTSSRGRKQVTVRPAGSTRRHVLHGVHGEVDLAGQQRLLDLLGEQALAAGLGERPVLDAVARGLDGAHLERPCVPARAPPPGARAPRAPAPAPAASRACRCGWWMLARADLPMLGGAGHRSPPVYAPVRALVQTARPHGMRPAGQRARRCVLGIETSCDETAAAVVARAAGRERAHPLQRRAGAVGAAPPLRRRGAGDRRAGARGVPRRDHRRGDARGGRRPRPASTPWR